MAKNKYATIPGFSKLSRQAIFDISAKHLLQQKQRSVNIPRGKCLYHYEVGDKILGCAAAPFLRLDMREQIDSRGSGATSWSALTSEGIVPAHNSEFICTLQGIHDGYQPYEWPEVLRRLAKDRGLDSSATKPAHVRSRA